MTGRASTMAPVGHHQARLRGLFFAWNSCRGALLRSLENDADGGIWGSDLMGRWKCWEGRRADLSSREI